MDYKQNIIKPLQQWQNQDTSRLDAKLYKFCVKALKHQQYFNELTVTNIPIL